MRMLNSREENRKTIDAILAGDADAYLQLVRRYSPAVYASLTQRIADPQTVDDLVQETFIAAYQALGRFDVERDFGAWIKGIARNKMLMYFREAYARKDVVVEMQDEILSTVWVGDDEAAIARLDDRVALVRRCLADMPERAREVLSARYFHDESVISIAARLGTTVDAVSCLLYRARRQLKVCVEAQSSDT